jgi:hypothetical protein
MKTIRFEPLQAQERSAFSCGQPSLGFSSFSHEPLYMWLTRREMQKSPGGIQ